MDGRVSDEAGQQVSNVRVCLPRREHGNPWLHRNVTLRAGTPQTTEASASPLRIYFFSESVFEEPPRSIFRPSGNSMSRELPRSAPSFAWNATTLILVPAGSEFRFQPRRSNTDGEPPSMRQRSTVPSAFVTSIVSQECGFTHSIWTTLPSSVTCLVASNSAEKEWCAATGNAAAISIAALAATFISLLCMGLTP